jgi:hypothetical protein
MRNGGRGERKQVRFRARIGGRRENKGMYTKGGRCERQTFPPLQFHSELAPVVLRTLP